MDTPSHRFASALSSSDKRALLAELFQKEVARTRQLPLSFAQQRLWFLHQLAPGSPCYNIARSVTISGSLTVLALEQSLNELACRHEIVRTRFVASGGEPVQVIEPVLRFRLPVKDLSVLAHDERAEQVRELSQAEARHPFDLAQDPLLRVQLLRLEEQEHILLLSMHHIIADEWSLGIFFRELSVLYSAFSTGRPSPLPALPLQYADYALWQREWLNGPVQRPQLVYWKEQLSNLTSLELPRGRARATTQTFNGGYE